MGGALSVIKLLRLSVSADIGKRWAFGLSLCLECLGIGLVTSSPFLLKQLVDRLTNKADGGDSLWLLVCLFVATWSASGLVSSLRATQSTTITAAIGRHLTARALQNVLPQSVRRRDSDSSRLAGLLERLPFSLAIIMDGLIWSSVPLLLQLVLSLSIASAVLPLTDIALLGLVMVTFAVVSLVGAARHQRVAQASNTAASAASHLLGDIVRNGRRIVLNGNLPAEIDLIENGLIEKGRRQVASAWSLARMSGLQFATLTLGLGALLGLAVQDVRRGEMTIGGLILLQAYAMRMVMPLGSFSFIFSHAGEAIANLTEVLGLQGDIATKSAPPVQIACSAMVQASTLHFDYAAGDAGIAGVDVEFPPGSVTAIVGANGSGKSTLAQVLAGIFTPQSGQVLVNGVDLQTIDPAHRHRWILYVPQSVSLFNRTLAENALYPPTQLSLEELQARLTAWSFYDSGRLIDPGAQVGEQGEKLSGGQIQKLELARISGVRCALLILDESTSALDPASEVQVVEDLKRTFAGRTSLVLITHRPASAAMADQVIWLAGGRVRRIGAHEELLKADADYRALWTMEATA